MQIEGKVFIVTGGASGLGEGTARMLAANGGKVVIADMQADKGEAIAREIGGAFVKCDVSQEADAQAVVAKAVSMGKLMGLVNCAGIAPAEKTVGKNGAHGKISIHGYSYSSHEQYDRLRDEGIVFDKNRQFKLAAYIWQPDVDEVAAFLVAID